jgi:hypothetical protein
LSESPVERSVLARVVVAVASVRCRRLGERTCTGGTSLWPATRHQDLYLPPAVREVILSRAHAFRMRSLRARTLRMRLHSVACH